MALGSILSDVGSAVGDLFSAEGSASSASAYGTASKIAAANEQIALRSGEIQQQQETRTITQALGAERADTAAAGMTTGGSGLYLMRSSLQQGALAKQLIANQSEITAQGFAQESAAYKGQEQAANAQAKGQGIGGLFSLVSAFL